MSRIIIVETTSNPRIKVPLYITVPENFCGDMWDFVREKVNKHARSLKTKKPQGVGFLTIKSL